MTSSTGLSVIHIGADRFYREIQFGWSFLSDREKRRTTGIPTATYTANVQAGTSSVIKIATSQSAAVTTNRIGTISLGRGPFRFVPALDFLLNAAAGLRFAAVAVGQAPNT